MRLLFDENLSPLLPSRLAAHFPGSAHVGDLQLTGADDALIWRRAAEKGFVLTTKDDDFSELSILHGAPPKLILIKLGNCRTAEITALLIEEAPRIARFVADQEASLLELP